jgi:zinc/manganese transport system substrate-binding protein
VRRRSLVLLAALAAVIGGLTGCGSTSDADSGKVRIVASTDVWGDVARQVGGDHVAVTSILTSPDQDPHSFEANPRTTLAISKADVLVENGGGYDDFMDTLRKAHNGAVPVLNAVDVSGKKASSGGMLNEHVFYDLPTAQKVADALAAELARQDPGNAADYRSGAQAFSSALDGLLTRATTLRAALDGKAIGITEPVPLYLTEALGLVNKTPAAFSEAVEEGGDMSARVLQDTLDLYADHQVAALVYNEQSSGPVTEKVEAAAKDAGIPVVGVTETLPAGKDYVAWMTSNLDSLATALGAG